MTTQTEFRTALLDAARPAPAGLTDPQGRPAGRRFSVYRNNVAVSLTEALQTSFPVVRALVGEAFFDAMAGVFLRAHPPTTPMLMFYGAALPGFLETFEPVAELPYLPDVARLELAVRTAYHAADAAALAADRLAALGPEALLDARLRLVPAVAVLRSDWPVAAIWHAHVTPGAPHPGTGPSSEEVLIARPVYDPTVDALPEGGAAFVAALAAGLTLGEAAEAAPPRLDLAATLGLLLQRACISDAQFEDAP